ncbi:hypothetical protein [Streptomyces ziwulingensis]|uniref:Uncharacterized protein n=1 Tax=Streptomyces ziwulingensis TaxID=1045501 RepID=A0ABP9D0D0_9ACTN
MPEPKPTAPAAAGHTSPLADAVLEAAVRDIERQTNYRDDTPTPAFGSALPVPQPGRPPMSQKAVDFSTMALSASAATIPPGAIAVGLMLASGYADPIVVGMVCAAPAFVAVPIIAIGRMLRGARPESEVHQHFHGPVTHQTTHTETRSVWARTDNRR